MMKTFLPVLVLVLGLSVPGIADDGGGTTPCDYKEFGLDGAKFFLYLTKDTPYNAWRLWPNKNSIAPATEPPGPFCTTYVNPAAYASITKREGMAFGSLIVMESRDADKKLQNLSVGLKVKGYNPAGGDWYWFAFAPDGAITAAGRLEACIRCHGKMRANDFVMSAPVK